jgi:hypothetical protein
MRERADAMEAAMRGAPMWEAGYRREIAGALGGPAGEMAAPWDLVTVHAVADWLDRFGDRVYCYGRVEFEYALIIARAYLGSTDA